MAVSARVSYPGRGCSSKYGARPAPSLPGNAQAAPQSLREFVQVVHDHADVRSGDVMYGGIGQDFSPVALEGGGTSAEGVGRRLRVGRLRELIGWIGGENHGDRSAVGARHVSRLRPRVKQQVLPFRRSLC